jgi:hypothetical protein
MAFQNLHICTFAHSIILVLWDFHGMGYAFVKVNGVMASLALEM